MLLHTRRALQAVGVLIASTLFAVGVRAWIAGDAAVTLWWPLYGVAFPFVGAAFMWSARDPVLGEMGRLLLLLPPLLFFTALDTRQGVLMWAAWMLVTVLVGVVYVLEAVVVELAHADALESD